MSNENKSTDIVLYCFVLFFFLSSYESQKKQIVHFSRSIFHEANLKCGFWSEETFIAF